MKVLLVFLFFLKQYYSEIQPQEGMPEEDYLVAQNLTDLLDFQDNETRYSIEQKVVSGFILIFMF